MPNKQPAIRIRFWRWPRRRAHCSRRRPLPAANVRRRDERAISRAPASLAETRPEEDPRPAARSTLLRSAIVNLGSRAGGTSFRFAIGMRQRHRQGAILLPLLRSAIARLHLSFLGRTGSEGSGACGHVLVARCEPL